MPIFHQQSRVELRQMYADAWRRFSAGQPLEPLQAQLAQVIVEHPEYHALLEAQDSAHAEFPPELGQQNPFLHMGLHLAIREQVSTDRPAGMAAAHAALSRRLGSTHEAEHKILEVLAGLLWEAQRSGLAPDESKYLEKILAL